MHAQAYAYAAIVINMEARYHPPYETQSLSIVCHKSLSLVYGSGCLGMSYFFCTVTLFL